jgi:glycopeptide antibiotics resistance protein
VRKRPLLTVVLIAYSALLIRLLVFKIKLLQLGPIRIRLPQHTGEANFLPLKTILPYLRGERGLLIAFLNVGGNIGLFVPIGFLVPFIYREITWQKALALAVGAGLVIEGMQVAFEVGIFDIDDVILNALGVMTGYWVFTSLVRKHV